MKKILPVFCGFVFLAFGSFALADGVTQFTVAPVVEAKIGWTPYNAAGFQDVVDYPGGPNRERGFTLLSAAVGISGQLYLTSLTYTLTAGSEAQDDGTLIFGVESANLRGRWHAAEARVDYGFTLGAMKVPFSRQSMTSQYRWQFLQPAIVVDELPIRRDIGASFDMAQTNETVGIQLRLGAYNGRGHRVYGPDNDKTPALFGRLTFDVVEAPAAGEGDARSRENRSAPQFSVGGSGMYNDTVDRSQVGIGVDVDLRWYGLSLLGEYIRLENDAKFAAGAAAALTAGKWTQVGWYAQSGYYLVPERLEVALRYDSYVQEIPSAVAPDQEFLAVTAGLSTMVWPNHGVKFYMNFTHRREGGGIVSLDNDTMTLGASFQY